MLFLHGFGQSIERCKKYNEHLFKRLSKEFDLGFVEGSFPANGFRPDEKSWWDTNDVLADLLEQRPVVSDELVASIPYADVLLGFSQGANLILHCLERRPYICKVAVICCGLRGNAFRGCESYFNKTLDSKHCTRPTVFVFGEKDQFVGDKERCDIMDIFTQDQDYFPAPSVLMHPGGHFIPQSASFVSQLCKEISERLPYFK